MKKEERDKRKARWMAHGYGIAKILREASAAITNTMNDVRDNDGNEYDAFTSVIEQMETHLHECNISSFTEKFLIYMLVDQELKHE